MNCSIRNMLAYKILTSSCHNTRKSLENGTSVKFAKPSIVICGNSFKAKRYQRNLPILTRKINLTATNALPENGESIAEFLGMDFNTQTMEFKKECSKFGPKIWSLKMPALRVLFIWVVLPAVMSYLRAWWKNKQKVKAADPDINKAEPDFDFLIDCIFTPIYSTVKLLSATFEGILCLGILSPSMICKEKLPLVRTASRMIAVMYLTKQMGENLVVYIISKLNMSYSQKKACLLGVKVFSVVVYLIGCLVFLEYAGLGFF